MPTGATQLEINGTNYDGLHVAYAEPTWTAGIYYCLLPIGLPPGEGNPEYELMPLTYFGIAGVGTKNGGFRGRDINAEMIAMYSTTTLAQAAKNALVDALANPALRFTVTVPGSTQRPKCKLKRDGAKEMGWNAIGGLHGLKFSLAIRQMESS